MWHMIARRNMLSLSTVCTCEQLHKVQLVGVMHLE